MLNTITTALSRRNVLLGLAASATAATSTGAKNAPAAPQENPALIALADDLPGIVSEYVAARDEVDRIVAEWSPRWPVPAEEIVSYGQGCKAHEGIDGRGIQTLWARDIYRVKSLGTPEYFAKSAESHEAAAQRKVKTKSQRGMKSELLWVEKERAAIEPARAYWSEVDRITKESGIEAATAKREAALKRLRQQVEPALFAGGVCAAASGA